MIRRESDLAMTCVFGLALDFDLWGVNVEVGHTGNVGRLATVWWNQRLAWKYSTQSNSGTVLVGSNSHSIGRIDETNWRTWQIPWRIYSRACC